MRILYDYQIFNVQKFGGISRYFYELLNEYQNLGDIETEASLLYSNNHYISSFNSIVHKQFIPQLNFRGKQRIQTSINRKNTIHDLKISSYDIFHPTYYDPYFLNYIDERPFVLTVHDMIHEKFSDLFPISNNISKNKKLLADRATKIIAVSENTKQDLIKIFNIDKNKISVVYHGNSMNSINKRTVSLSVPPKFILFVGSRDGYKNFTNFVKAISPLLIKDTELSIVCVGGGPFKKKELKLFSVLNIRNNVYQNNLDDNLLAYYYEKAIAFIFPSLYEGFGIPILESFSCNCPLICSNTSSFPEVAGNAAIYFDPEDITSIREAIEKILKDKSIRSDLIRKSRSQLRKFSWSRTADRTKEVYKSLI